MSSQQPTRSDLPTDMTWDLAPMFATDDAWEAEFATLEDAEMPIVELQGQLTDSPATLARAFQLRDDLERKLELLYVYAHLKSDEDTGNSHYSGMQDRIRSRYNRAAANLSWIEPEILAASAERLREFIESAQLAAWRRPLQVLLRNQPHTLSASEEKLLAMAAEPLGVAQNAFSKLNNADMEFPVIQNEDGEEVRLTHGNYIRFLESPRRELRKRAFEAVYGTYDGIRNTLATTLDGNVRKHVFYARARNFPSALEASLHRDQVAPALYRSLIEAVHEGLPVFHDYMQLRQEALGLSSLDMYDLHVPILPDLDMRVPYGQACEWITDALAPLGDAYSAALRQGLEGRWVDVLECRGKRSGAYSSGCYDSNPYILMNYQDNLNSVFTLVHEFGHSLHSYFSHQEQPHHTADYSIVVAEVASITNEALLLDHLKRQKQDDPKVQAYLLAQLCDGFRTTMYRQTMFAEFELIIHEMVEQGQALTTDALNEAYFQLNHTFHKPIAEPHPRIALEWARIPHFYYNFYVYKYATAFAAAQAFADKLLGGDSADVDAYLGFLKAGASKDPLDILADAGVDLRDPSVITGAIARFRQAVDTLGDLLPNLD